MSTVRAAEDKMALFHINKMLLPLKVCHFLVFAGMACVVPYIPVYFVSLGMDVWQVGILRALEPVIAFICTPVWGGYADKYGKHRLCLTVAVIGAGAMYSLFVLVSYIAPSPHPCYDVRNMSECSSETVPSELPQCMIDRRITSTELTIEGTEPHSVDFCDGACYAAAGVRSGNQMFGMCSSTIKSIEGNYTDWQCQTCDIDMGEYDTSDLGVQYSILIFCQSLHTYKSSSSDDKSGNGTIEAVDVFYSNDEVCPNPFCCKCEVDGMELSKSRIIFISCFVLTILGSAFYCNIPSYIDAATLAVLGEDKQNYGKQRLWGTVGFGLAGFAGGILVDVFTRAIGSSGTRYEPIFVIYAITMTLLLSTTFFIKLPEHQRPRRMSKNLLALFHRPAVVMFLVVVIVEGISLGMTYSYLMIYWKDELGASLSLLGFSVLITTVAETPALYISGWVIEQIGYRGVVYLTLIAYAVRYLCYGIIQDPWLVLPVQLLHGITFGIGWPVFTMYANQIAPEGMAATLQSMKTSAHIGVGSIIGNLVGGFVYNQFGARHLFLGNSILCILTALVFFATEMVLGHHRSSDQGNGGTKDVTSKDMASRVEEYSLNEMVMKVNEEVALKPTECSTTETDGEV